MSLRRRVRAGAKFVACPNCENHTAEIHEDRRLEGGRGWVCHDCQATGRFWPDGEPALLTRPAPAPSNR